jgi:hypothetical protein
VVELCFEGEKQEKNCIPGLNEFRWKEGNGEGQQAILFAGKSCRIGSGVQNLDVGVKQESAP